MPELLHPRMADVYREKVGSLCVDRGDRDRLHVCRFQSDSSSISSAAINRRLSAALKSAASPLSLTVINQICESVIRAVVIVRLTTVPERTSLLSGSDRRALLAMP